MDFRGTAPVPCLILHQVKKWNASMDMNTIGRIMNGPSHLSMTGSVRNLITALTHSRCTL